MRCLLLALLLCPIAARAADPAPFIVLGEFQVWADPSDRDYALRALSRLYNTNEKQKTNSGFLVNQDPRRGNNYTWSLEETRHWLNEAIALGCFNLYCLGDDLRPAEGHLFDANGINPLWKGFFFDAIALIHSRGLMAAVEPKGLPTADRSKAAYKRWAQTFLDPALGKDRIVDIIKLSLEWFDAYYRNPGIADETAAFLEAVREVNPDVLVYIDSIGGKYWQNPNPFHYWLATDYPKVLISHYLNVDAVPAFRAAGFANMMSQINPSEGSHFFIYHDRTVTELKKVVEHRVRYISLAGTNWIYEHYNYDLFLEIIRPHLKLAKNMDELRQSLETSKPDRRMTRQEVRADAEAFHRAHPGLRKK